MHIQKVLGSISSTRKGKKEGGERGREKRERKKRWSHKALL